LKSQDRCNSQPSGRLEEKSSSLRADQLDDLVVRQGNEAKKAPHEKAVAGVSAEDRRAVADYLQTLK
jgi:hypothetical protein